MENTINDTKFTSEEEFKELMNHTDDIKDQFKVDGNSFKMTMDAIKEMKDWFKVLTETTTNHLNEEFKLKESILEDIIPFEKDSLPSTDVEEIRDFLSSHSLEDNLYEVMDEIKLRDTMLEVKNMSLLILSSRKESENIYKESEEIMKEYYNYMSSDKIKEVRKNRLESIKEAYENETDRYKKRKMKEMADSLSSTLDYSYIYERFKKYDWEVDNIDKAFFDMKRGSYVIERYRTHIKHFGFNEDIYKLFFNIEENFLPEEYHKFNNLFLFIYMRRIGYLDFNNKNDVLIAQAFTSSLANLIYHKFTNTDEEKDFIEAIKQTLDYFKKFSDKYEKENTTYKNHPNRIAFEKEHSKKRFEEIKEKCDRMKIEVPDDINTAEDLQKLYNEKMDEMISSQLEKEKENEKDPNVEIEGAEMVDDLEKLSNELEEASKLIDDIPDEEFE